MLKLIANRHKDQRDLIELAGIEGVDWAYVRQWATTWDVEANLEQLLNARQHDA